MFLFHSNHLPLKSQEKGHCRKIMSRSAKESSPGTCFSRSISLSLPPQLKNYMRVAVVPLRKMLSACLGRLQDKWDIVTQASTLMIAKSYACDFYVLHYTSQYDARGWQNA